MYNTSHWNSINNASLSLNWPNFLNLFQHPIEREREREIQTRQSYRGGSGIHPCEWHDCPIKSNKITSKSLNWKLLTKFPF